MADLAAETEAALEAALCAFDGIGGIQVIREPDLVRTIAPGKPYGFLNGAMALDLEPARVEERVSDMDRAYRDRGLPLTWWITPHSRPADVANRLESAGLTPEEDEAGMAIDLVGWTEPDLPAGLSIEVVVDRVGLADWVGVMGRSYGWDDPVKADTLRELYDPEPGDGVARPGIQLLVRRDGEPVGCGSLFESGGFAWVTNIGTVPAARRRGVGGAVTGRILSIARERGHGRAFLAASLMGEPVYRRMGFVTTCRLGRLTRALAAVPGPLTG
jgi:GNAT superfamily N-acetyltransferase